jgi:hypothetical protein
MTYRNSGKADRRTNRLLGQQRPPRARLKAKQRAAALAMINKGAADVEAMLAAGGHPFQLEQVSAEEIEVSLIPCGRPGCLKCG